ncbi:MAG TPA: translation initiation factor IF-2 [Bacteroidales bacterium]|nr:translation initiation factor IF-2 [Bacteroidales bacterium]
MAVNKVARLSKLAKEFNVGISTIVEFLRKKGYEIESNPNTKVSPELYDILAKEYSSEISVKKESEKLSLRNLREKKETVSIHDIVDKEEDQEESEDQEEEVLIKDTREKKSFEPAPEQKKSTTEPDIKVVGKIDLDSVSSGRKKEKVEAKEETEPKAEQSAEAASEKEKKATPDKTKEEKPEVSAEDKPKTTEKETDKKQVEETKAEEQKSEKPAKEAPDEVNEKRDLKVIGRIDLESMNQRTRPVKGKKTKEKAVEAVEKKEVKAEEQAKKEKPAAEKEKKVESVEKPENKKEEDKAKKAPEPAKEEKKEKEKKGQNENFIRAKVEKLTGPTVVGRIDLPDKKEEKKKPVASSSHGGDSDRKKRKRKRIRVDNQRVKVDENKKNTHAAAADDKSKGGAFKKGKKKKRPVRQEVSEEDVQKQIKDTLARLTSKGKSKGSKYRREKRDVYSQRQQEEIEKKELEKNTLKVTEFVSVNELANMMDVPVNEVISTCMNLGLFVSINQRLDAETMALVADEFNYKVEFVSVDLQDSFQEEEDDPESLEPRSPIVTVMGHVDHGKTKLLDYIRHSNVIAGEAGGITQHIGAYSVTLDNDRQITFLDTPGHEAFTAMRARGAQITDVAIIVVAADDGVMPQTVEAINHAHAAGVPIVFAINKIDKSTANPEKIKEELANMNFLVEDWGGKYQSQEISAKNGINIEELLEKVLLEAELLELNANPNKRAVGTVIESSLDKGRGYVATILVEAGTLKIGDVILAGSHYGHVKAMYNERGKKVELAGPATPVLILGLNGAPQAGDTFNVMEGDREAKEIAVKREQLQREQGLRTQKHITLDEIGRRIAIGNFQELNVIVKGDVDGSVEALSDSLIKLSTEEIQVNVIHKAVGQISESDILLAAASNAVIIGFQVRPSMNARKLAEKEEIDVRLYSIIYDAINELRDAMEGMLSPELKEEIVATLEVRDTFKVSKIGTVAGCMVKEGKISRNSKVRVIRDGIVVYSGELGSLKRFKDDVKEVSSGYECGLNIGNFNDIKVGDIIEAYKEVEVRKKL